MNQLRLGQITDGRKSLETSFTGDPYNVWVKNTLDLLDTYKNYDLDHEQQLSVHDREGRVADSRRSISRIWPSGVQDVLHEVRLQAAAADSHRGVSQPRRFLGAHGWPRRTRRAGRELRNDAGVRFAGARRTPVRSTGARRCGTSWRTRSRSARRDNRVPRWLSEGLSVYEEHHARPGWGFNVTPDFLAAFKAGKLVPVSRMNDGFMHPAFPQQVQLLVLPGVARLRADRARLRRAARWSRCCRRTRTARRRTSGLSARAEHRHQGVRQEVRRLYPNAVRRGAAVDHEGAAGDHAVDVGRRGRRRPRRSAERFRRAAAVGRGRCWRTTKSTRRSCCSSARERCSRSTAATTVRTALLATAYEKKGDKRKQADVLAKWTTLTEDELEGAAEARRSPQSLGDARGAADALDRAMFINPFDMAMHERLADLAHAAGDKQKSCASARRSSRSSRSTTPKPVPARPRATRGG